MNFDFRRAPSGQLGLDLALDEILDAQLVNRTEASEPEYAFKHALVQDTAYATLLKEERHRLHYRVARALETGYAHQLDEHAARLAQHYAAAGDYAKTFEYALRAADVAVRRYNYAQARSSYAQALEALAHLPQHPENQRQYVDAILKQMRVTRLAVDPQENLNVLKQVEAITRSLLEGPEAEPDDPLRLGRIHYWIGTIHVMRTELVAATENLEQAIAMAHQLKNPLLEARAISVLLGVMTMRGDVGKAIPLLAQELERYEKAGNVFEWVYVLAMLSYCHAAQGHYTLALAEGERAIARARELNNRTRLVEVVGTVLGIYAHGGDMPKFLELVRYALAAAEQAGERVYLFLYVQRAYGESRTGNAKAAIAELERVKALYLGDIEHQFFADWLVAGEAEIRLAAGELDKAIALAQRAIAIAQREKTLYGGGFAERAWGRALMRLDPPQYPEAEAHLAAALELFREGDLRLDAARTLVALGELQSQRGNPAQAREHLEQAADQFRISGIGHELSETLELMRGLATPELHSRRNAT